MRARFVLFVVMAVLFAAALPLAAQTPDKYEGREQIKIDHEAMKSMTWEERRAAMQAYKAARAAEAQRAGDVIPTERQMNRLDTPRKVAESAVQRQNKAAAFGTIQYDSGTVTGTGGMASQMLGNRFDTALNTAGTACCFPVPTTGSVTMITFDMQITFFGSVVFSLYSNIAGTMAAQVTSMARPGVATGLNTLSVMTPTTANAYMNGAFLAGIWQFNPTMTALGIDTGTNASQGFHGISLNDGAAGSMLTTVTTGGGMGINAVFRVSGNVVTPVELMSFTIED